MIQDIALYYTSATIELMNWEQYGRIFERDGSLRDLYVKSTTLKDWEDVLAFLRKQAYDVTYSVDGKASSLPQTISEAFNHEKTSLLSVRVGRTTLNCHFFCPDEIEFDLDPREIQGREDYAPILTFMTAIGALLKKEACLTPENCPNVILCKYDPVLARVEVIL
jgi:hypothetical protein